MAIVGSVVDPTGIASAIINPVAQTLLGPVTDRLRYIISCRKYVGIMQIKMRELNTAKISVKERIMWNTRNHFKIPSQIRDWLDDVEGIEANVENFPSDAISCCSLMIRHKLGRKAFKITEQIESLTRQHLLISWIDDPVPLGKVDSINASTSAPSSDHHDEFRSREATFTKAFKALGPSHKTHMIALCGMGGVGKTTMMQRLKKVAKERKMFGYIVEAVIGEKTDPIAIQEAVANYLSIELKETIKSARAERLRKWFKDNSDGGKTKFLIILDDVWQSVDLNDIGLSPMADQGVDFKILLTSRDIHVCTLMGVEANSILNVGFLTEAEAQSLFLQFVKPCDPELTKIMEEITRKCCGLPIAIKTMACTLKYKRKDAWNDALSRLQNHDVENVAGAVIRTSYEKLPDEETKRVFLMCGLFPNDFNIPTEELVRYGWGLKLFDRVYSIKEGRFRLNTCIERLVQTNLLTESDDVGCVKMHDLVSAFVLDMFSKVEYASIVNHGNMPGWPESNIADSCKTISLTCKSISGFPRDLKFPNLTILKLMHGEESLRFPEDFYGEMEKLQVIAYDTMECPLLPSSHHQCSTNLRVLHLHQCSLMIDFSSIGNLLNLEVLSFANSGIEWLPSAIGNLKKLRLLDLTDCVGLRIDNGVLENLVKLEEIYMRTNNDWQKAIRFTDGNCIEMAERSKNLSALEFEFFENNVQPKNMTFEKLERFKISMGCYLNPDFFKTTMSFKNSLQLVTSKDELLVSRMNELFEKTELLHLQVDGMTDFEDVEVNASHPPQSSSFHNLKALVVTDCPQLEYLFTLRVSKALSKLESLEVCSCNNMKELIHIESNEEYTITFPKLKNLSLRGLERLSGLCCNVYKFNFPQLVGLELCGIPNITSIYPNNKLTTSSFIKEEFVIPKLEILKVDDLKDLKEIWAFEFKTSEEVKLRNINVNNCDSLVNLFPCNPMPFLYHLEQLEVKECGSIEVLFHVDLDCLGEIGKEASNSSLRRIQVEKLGKLREVWRIKDENNNRLLINGFQAVQTIEIVRCDKFRNLVTPTATNFDLGALLDLYIHDCGESGRTNDLVESSQEQEITTPLAEETSQVNDSISNVLFPPCHMHLHHLYLWNYKGVKVVLEIESPRSGVLIATQDNQQQLLPYLKTLCICEMDTMTHLLKCNLSKILFLQTQQYESPFINLTTIELYKCKRIKYLFSPLIAQLLSNLMEVEIAECDDIEEIVSARDDEDTEKTTPTNTHTTTSLFLRLKYFTLRSLPNLRGIGGGGCANTEISFNDTSTTTAFDDFKFLQVDDVSWTLCQYPERISIVSCDVLRSLIPFYALGSMQKLKELVLWHCNGMKEVFETQVINNSGCHSTIINIDEGNGDTPAIPRVNKAMKLKLPNLKILQINNCGLLEHIFPFSALESLRQLEQLKIKDCKSMKVIVKEDDNGEQTTIASKELVVLLRLKSIELDNLPDLVGFFLGMNEFQWPLLDNVTIHKCPQMIGLTCSRSTAPKLKYIQSRYGKHSLEYGLNFPVTTTPHQTPFATLDSTSLFPASSQGIHWSFHNLIELDVESVASVEKIIPSNKLLQLKNLEKIHVMNCGKVVEIFETLEVTNGTDFNKSQTTVVKLPNLIEVDLNWLPRLTHVWNNNRLIAFEFPNLSRVSIVNCDSLKHVFTSSMVTCLLQLQELFVCDCDHIEEVIVKDTDVVVEEKEESNGKVNEITLTRLKSLKLKGLKVFKGFCLLEEDVLFPSLNTLQIKGCPAITIFTKGKSATPELKSIETSSGSLNVGEDINSCIKINQETSFASLDSTSLCPASSHGMHFPFHDLIELNVEDLACIEKIIPSSELLHLQNLEKIHVAFCGEVVEVFEALEGTNSTDFDESQTTIVKLPNLTEVELTLLPCLTHVWKNNQLTAFEFPNLTRVSIWGCDSLKHVFTSSMVGSLLQLQELSISDCNQIEEVIVKDVDAVVEEEEKSDDKMNKITLPRLNSLKLEELKVFKGFCLLEEEILFPSLNTLQIKGCPAITFFTKGNSSTPELKSIETSSGSVDVWGDINYCIKINQEA